MNTYLNVENVKLEWIGPKPSGKKRAALLIPQYNESSNCDMNARLEYYRSVLKKHKSQLDVIVIDDGSTDNSLNTIKDFILRNPSSFHIASVLPNGNKVGALYKTVQAIHHDLIILSDFDTDLRGIQNLLHNMECFENDKNLMGFYFRMLPYEGRGGVFCFQQLEYAMARSVYRFHSAEKSVRVMPGAGSCYRRAVLASIFNQHSGLRSGEDRESTLIGLKLGYKAQYMSNVLALTRPPLKFKTLIKQRVRWNLGYLETFHKEKKFYFSQIAKLTRVGWVTASDIVMFFFLLSYPLVIVALAILNWKVMLFFCLGVYTLWIMWGIYLIIKTPVEYINLRRRYVLTLLAFPFIKIAVEHLAWSRALKVFIKKLWSR